MKQLAVISAARTRTTACSVLLREALVKRRSMASMESLVRLVARSNRKRCIRLRDVSFFSSSLNVKKWGSKYVMRRFELRNFGSTSHM